MATIKVNTTSYALLEISRAAFEEIETRLRLKNVDYPFHLMDTGGGHVIDLSGICIGIDPKSQDVTEPIIDLRTLVDQEHAKRRPTVSEVEQDADAAEAKRIAQHFPPMIGAPIGEIGAQAVEDFASGKWPVSQDPKTQAQVAAILLLNAAKKEKQ